MALSLMSPKPDGKYKHPKHAEVERACVALAQAIYACHRDKRPQLLDAIGELISIELRLLVLKERAEPKSPKPRTH